MKNGLGWDGEFVNGLCHGLMEENGLGWECETMKAEG